MNIKNIIIGILNWKKKINFPEECSIYIHNTNPNKNFSKCSFFFPPSKKRYTILIKNLKFYIQNNLSFFNGIKKKKKKKKKRMNI